MTINGDAFDAESKEVAPEGKLQISNIKKLAQELYNELDKIGSPEDIKAAKTKLHEAVHWATKAITHPVVDAE